MINALSDRKQYSSLNSCSYLNQASLGLIGEQSVQAMHTFLEKTARHGNLKMTDAEEASFLVSLRKRITALTKVQETNIAIVSCASDILSQVPRLFYSPKKRKVILVSTDFPAITRPWISYSKKKKIKLTFITECKDESLTNRLLRALDENTNAVCVSYVQFASGTRLDIDRLRAATSALGIKLMVDVTQAAGAVPLSLDRLNLDLVVCSGYKWLGGHGGIAFAIFSDKLLKKNPISVGWFGGENPFDLNARKLLLSSDARKYTKSTLSYISAIGLNISISNLIDLGLDNIENHAHGLACKLLEKLQGTDWEMQNKPGSKEFSSHLISLQNPKVCLKRVLKKLRDNQIICGMRNNLLRVSICHYNNEADIKKLVSSLQYVS